MSSNINEVIRAVLNFLFFFTKRFCSHQKHQKRQDHKKDKKHKKHQKTLNTTEQKHKMQISEQKLKMRLKTS